MDLDTSSDFGGTSGVREIDSREDDRSRQQLLQLG